MAASSSQGENSKCTAKPRKARATMASRTRAMIPSMVISLRSGHVVRGQGGVHASRLPPTAAAVDPDQPWFHPGVHPGSIRVIPVMISSGSVIPAAAEEEQGHPSSLVVHDHAAKVLACLHIGERLTAASTGAHTYGLNVPR